MSTRFMVIDADPKFRSLLMHHLTTHWPDAIVQAYDPVAAGFLPDEFSGAGNDLILLGDEQGDRSGLEELARFSKREHFPPLVYFGQADELADAKSASAFMVRDQFKHRELTQCLAALLNPKLASLSPTLFGAGVERSTEPLVKGYRLVTRLASTRHSAVYLADRVRDDLRVVLKVFRQVTDAEDSLAAFDRFLQEYELIAEVKHGNIVTIYELVIGDEHSHIAMEYLGGGDLRQRISAGITEKEAVSYLRQIASALDAVHGVGILHRDLKPGNVMLRDDGSVALIDFGLAKRMRLKLALTDSGEIFGTPYYMSPEQGHGNDIDERSDIYSLGVIFYEMLTGHKPYESDSAMGIIYKHAQAPVPLLPTRFARYQMVINMMMAKKPHDRISNAAEIDSWL
ncbi:MAG: serine/threonine-protein kinase [Woeseiaceae bacterium]|nr:serine/threonine-protein kinase [Woeseiaceae bacterium]